MIGGAVARRRRRHVAQDHIGRPVQRLFDARRRAGGEEIESQHRRPRDRVHAADIDGDELALGLARLDPLGGDGGPAARRRAEIDHPLAGAEKTEALIDLDELEGGARTKAEALGLGDVGVVELTLEPAGR